MTPIPVTILTGFLGSGKTTLMNRLLKEKPNVRFGLVVNEFGEAALESQLIESRKHPLYELPSGCLCCVSDGDLQAALDAVMKKDERIGHIVVEASGLSSPGPLLGVLTQDEGRYRLSGVFCVVDTTAFLTHEQEFGAVRRQLVFADAVFLTKTDLADSANVRSRLNSLKPGVKILDTADRLPWSALFETAATPEPQPFERENTPQKRFFQGGRHHDAEVFEFTSDSAFDPDKLAEFFRTLDPGILRAKGFVRLADATAARYKYLVQYTGTQKQLYSRPWEKNEARRTNLLFLGTSFNAETLKAGLESCLALP